VAAYLAGMAALRAACERAGLGVIQVDEDGQRGSEGGLDPRSRWYITETVIHHRSKLTRQGPAGPAFRRRHEAAAPACPISPGM
jgi:hypothetical protein